MATALLDFSDEARVKYPPKPKKKKKNKYDISDSESDDDVGSAGEEQEPDQPPNEGELLFMNYWVR